jgi:tetratricopeptide (TPR) repeat protein
LGLVKLDNFGNCAEAVACFQKACELSPNFGVAWFFAGVAQLRSDAPSDAVVSLQKAERCGHHTAAVAELMGDAFYNLGEFAAAARAYRKAHDRQPDSALIESKLGLALGRSGETEEAIRRTKEALNARPDVGELHDRMIQLLVWMERPGDAAAAAEQKLRTVPKTSAADFARAARLWHQTGNLARAVAVLHVGMQLHQFDPLLNQLLAELREGEPETVNHLVTALRKATDGSFQH